MSHFLTAVHFTSNFNIFTQFELNTWVAALLLAWALPLSVGLPWIFYYSGSKKPSCATMPVNIRVEFSNRTKADQMALLDVYGRTTISSRVQGSLMISISHTYGLESISIQYLSDKIATASSHPPPPRRLQTPQRWRDSNQPCLSWPNSHGVRAPKLTGQAWVI